MIVDYIYERACTNQDCRLNMADRLSSSDDCINSKVNSVNSEKNNESNNKDIESDNEDIVLIEEETQERQEFLTLERFKNRIWEYFGF